MKPNPHEKSHFEDEDPQQICRHREHNPPSHMVIPHGKRYVHICPGCGFRCVLRNNGATLSVSRPGDLPTTAREAIIEERARHNAFSTWRDLARQARAGSRVEIIEEPGVKEIIIMSGDAF